MEGLVVERRSYSKEFNRQAVDLILVEEQPIRFVARTLDIHEHELYRWITEQEKVGDQAFSNNGSNEFISKNKIKNSKNKIDFFGRS